MATARESTFCVHHNNCQCVRVISPFGFASSVGLDVEVSLTGDRIILENSQDQHLPVEERPRVSYTYEEWDIFIRGVKDGQFDLPKQDE